MSNSPTFPVLQRNVSFSDTSKDFHSSGRQLMAKPWPNWTEILPSPFQYRNHDLTYSIVIQKSLEPTSKLVEEQLPKLPSAIVKEGLFALKESVVQQ